MRLVLSVVCASVLLIGCTSTQSDAEPGEAEVGIPVADSAETASTTPEPAEPPTASVEGTAEEELGAARAVLENYYTAINDGAFERAYVLWSDSGRASNQTFDEFRAGYAGTSEARLVVGEGSIEGAAGSRYAEFPVRIDAVTRDGVTQRFEGSYVLRRAVVDGATEEQRTWRIYSADIREVR